MNLLPKKLEEFREKEYWDKFFVKRKQTPFEWYGNYLQLSTMLHKCIAAADKILVIGCGNSRLSADLYDVGFHRITNVDISKVVIGQMKKQHERRRPNLKWLCADATERMKFSDCEFDVVLDKGTLDALMTGDDDEAVTKQVVSMFSEVERLLRIAGRYVCISLLQEHILKMILDWFLERKWKVSVFKNPEETNKFKEISKGIKFPVFIIVCTKLDALSVTDNSVLECSFNTDCVQAISRTDLLNTVRSFQQLAFLQHDLSNGSLEHDEVAFDLCIGTDDRPRYQLYVVDRPRQKTNKFAIFIVPQGRETEWLFGSVAGRNQLAECASYERLIVVHLNRNHAFENLDSVKSELSSKVMELSQKGLPRNSVVPFLSVGESIGKRYLRYKGNSETTGDFVVEDVEGEDGKMFRRLVFLNNSNVIQSEAMLIADANCSIGNLVVSNKYLMCKHHVAMVAGLSFLSGSERVSEFECRILLIGLGGGGLAMFLNHHFPKISVDVVELDQSVVNLAKDWFGLISDDHMKVVVADGLDYVKQTSANCYDIVMVDVDSKDMTIGMSCPPETFVTEETLAMFRGILKDKGMFILNLVCRNPDMHSSVLNVIKAIFGHCCVRKIEDEVNEIIYSQKDVKSIEDVFLKAIKLRLKCLHEQLKRNFAEAQKDDVLCLNEMLDNLSLLK